MTRPHSIARRYEAQPFRVQGVFPLKFNHPEKFANTTITPKAIKALIEGHKGDAFGFQVAIEGERCEGLHSALHFIFGAQSNIGQIGSDMGDTSYSPNGAFSCLCMYSPLILAPRPDLLPSSRGKFTSLWVALPV